MMAEFAAMQKKFRGCLGFCFEDIHGWDVASATRNV